MIEGGVVSFVRTDHIGRPIFATNASGAKVWEVSYLPFGWVRVATGSPVAARFPGQWFQTETGLHQNWMRDYDPTTGRYIEPDPLGLIDGASVYGYVKANPGRYVDPRGEDCRVIGYDKYGNALLDCNSGRPYCPPGEDCNWRNPTENQLPNSEYNQCKRECETIFDPDNWTGDGPHKKCLAIGWLFGKVTRSKMIGSAISSSLCRDMICGYECAEKCGLN